MTVVPVWAPTPETPGVAAPDRVSRDRLTWIAPAAVGTIACLAALLTITAWPVGAFQDDAIYTVLAKSLSSGQGYRMLNLPGAPHATHYPPGYPVFLAMLSRLAPAFPASLAVFKAANAVLLGLAALATFHFTRRRAGLGTIPSAIVALVGTISIVLLLVTGVVMSEPLFVAVLLGALLLAERAAETGGARTAAAAGLALGALALVRTIGAVGIPAAALVLLLRRRPLAAAVLVAAGASLVLPWQLWVNAHQAEIPAALMGKYGAYGPWMAVGYREGGVAFAKGVIAANVRGVKGMMGYMFLPVSATGPRLVAFLAVVLLVAGGMRVLVRQAPVTAAFVALYVTATLVWPFDANRFLWAIWPLLALAVAVGVRELWRSSRTAVGGSRRAAMAALGVACCLAPGYTWYNARGYRERWWVTIQQQTGTAARPIVEWVVGHTSPQDVVSSEHDLIVYLYTGRQAVPVSAYTARERVVPLTAEEDLNWTRQIIRTYRPRYYIVSASPAARRAASALAAERPPTLRLADSTGNTLIYEMIVR